MKLNYNLVGEKRKSLAGAAGEILNQPAHYLGAPSFEYEVGAYRVGKTGLVADPDSRELEAALKERGFTAEVRAYDEAESENESAAPDILTIEMPTDGFSPEKLDNLFKMVDAKAVLLKAALGTDELPIRQTDGDGGRLCFPWFPFTDDADTVAAYTALIAKLCEAAKEKKRVTAREREVDNPKYAMRCWLLSLGFIGDEYKRARKILLANLKGDGSYKSRVR
ncbi:MAG: virulence protein [Clostridiales bacterium]|nr:virulence protein [Clostridiales bacterium]